MCGNNRIQQHCQQPPTGLSLAAVTNFHSQFQIPNRPQTFAPIPAHRTDREHLEQIMAHSSLAFCGFILIILILLLEQVQLLEYNYDEELLQSNHPSGHQHHIPFRNNQHEDLYDHETSDSLYGNVNNDFAYFDMDEYAIPDHDNDYYLNKDYDQMDNYNFTDNSGTLTNINLTNVNNDIISQQTLQNASMSNAKQTNLSTNNALRNYPPQQQQSHSQSRRKPSRTQSQNEAKFKKLFTQLNPQVSSESPSDSITPFLTSSLRESLNNAPISDTVNTRGEQQTGLQSLANIGRFKQQ